MIQTDAFDLKMLAALQDDGRLTNQQLADLVGLSASQCSRRRMRLEEEKVIAGYHADLASEALGFNLVTMHYLEKGSMFGMVDFGKRVFKDRSTVYADDHTMGGLTKEQQREAMQRDRGWLEAEREWKKV